MMIEKTYQCRQCGSSDLIKNGHNQSGSQQYHCKACGAYLVLESKATPKKRDLGMPLTDYPFKPVYLQLV